MGKLRDSARKSGDWNACCLPIDVEGVSEVISRVSEAVRSDSTKVLRHVLPVRSLEATLQLAAKKFKTLPPVIDVEPRTSVREIVVVGDTHGQFTDLMHLLRLSGNPSQERMMIFNGDYVDRGAWGIETFVVILLLRLSMPDSVVMLRGNHESSTCTKLYGFYREVMDKYGMEDGPRLYKMFKKVFCVLPLAAVINKVTLVLHGGLFRGMEPYRNRRVIRGRMDETMKICEFGSLAELRNASRGGTDPNGLGSSSIASDVLWSDPAAGPGLVENTTRGIGTLFGPDVTDAFMSREGLRLIIRSHEGPDARAKRPELPQLYEGFSIDHDVGAGRLVTVFSSPNYPQFVEDEALRIQNKGAFVILEGPDWAAPRFITFDAILPRPLGKQYYSSDAPDSDVEFPGHGFEDVHFADKRFHSLLAESEFPATPSDAQLCYSPLPGHAELRKNVYFTNAPHIDQEEIHASLPTQIIEGFDLQTETGDVERQRDL